MAVTGRQGRVPVFFANAAPLAPGHRERSVCGARFSNGRNRIAASLLGSRASVACAVVLQCRPAGYEVQPTFSAAMAHMGRDRMRVRTCRVGAVLRQWCVMEWNILWCACCVVMVRKSLLEM